VVDRLRQPVWKERFAYRVARHGCQRQQNERDQEHEREPEL